DYLSRKIVTSAVSTSGIAVHSADITISMHDSENFFSYPNRTTAKIIECLQKLCEKQMIQRALSSLMLTTT
ncbi:MAG: hypothetical protein PUP92_19305, partial [Rhizonema sp. PD38]|nr:hypothetical protein [Rhizonema sp. PD38]